MDDIIIALDTVDLTEDKLIKAHEKDLRRVMGVLVKQSIVCKPRKTSLLVREVEFAGHVVGHGQRGPMPENWRPYATWKNPRPSVNSSP